MVERKRVQVDRNTERRTTEVIPVNNIIIEPRKVVMPSEATKMNIILRKEGIDVIEVETSLLSLRDEQTALDI